jgi:hypothetical protein
MKRLQHKISKHIPSIFQGRLDFAAPRPGLALSVEHPLERTIMRGLFFMLVALICGYLYFVGASILHVIARKEALAESAKLSRAVGALESRYFALADDVDIDSGARVGLAPVTDVGYVYRPGAVGRAETSANEI